LKVSLNWIRDLIDFDMEPHELADRLTMRGLAVEDVEHLCPEVQGVVTGRVTEVKRHPNADRLVVCRVDAGQGRSYRVVCGAPNVTRGAIYPFAPPGAVLPGGVKIKERPVRGEVSSGMLCSARELEIGPEANGILELTDVVNVGADIVRELGLEDYIFDIEVTANRFDLFSHVGVAREVRAIVGGEWRHYTPLVKEGGEGIDSIMDVDLQSPHGCPRYMARIIRGVTVGPSPFWLSRRLEALGLRSINNVVDASNYVLLELGHPMHTFDINNISGHKILVRQAFDGEKIVTLDGEERELDRETVAIADEEKAVAIAGIMGGLDTEVRENTRDILIECAHFNPSMIRASSRRLGLYTDASFRFERWVDPNGLPFALDRVTALIQDLAGGEVMRGRIDRYPDVVKGVSINLRPGRVGKVLGTKIGVKKMVDLLGLIDLPGCAEDNLIEVDVPTFRRDLMLEIDLIEEIARLIGYDRLEATGGALFDSATHVDRRGRDAIKSVLVAHGFREVYTTSFLGPDEVTTFLQEGDLAGICRLRNPVSVDAEVLRPSLLPGLLKVLRLNLNRNMPDIRIFETGTVFGPVPSSGKVPEERLSVAGLMVGKESPVHWSNGKERTCDFFDMKGVLNSLLCALGFSHVAVDGVSRRGFHPGKCASIEVDGHQVGLFGEIDPSLRNELDLPESPLLFEMDGNFLEQGEGRQRCAKISSYPAVNRDLSILVPRGVRYRDLEEAVRDIGGELLESVRLYDIYKGHQVPSDQLALAFSLVFRSLERTLRDEEVDRLMEELFHLLEKKFNARLRPMAGP